VPEGKGGKGPLGSIVLVAAAVVAAVAVVIGFLYLSAPRATRVRVGDMAPDFTLPPVFTVAPAGGSPSLRLSSTRGGPTFLFFFDTRRDGNESYVDSLQRMNKRYAGRGLTVVGIALDPDIGTVRTFLDRIYVEFPVLSDPFASVLHARYGTPRDPEAYLLDAQGRVVAVFTERVDWNTSEFRQRLERVLGPPPPGW
jgi:peroxiredoxin